MAKQDILCYWSVISIVIFKIEIKISAVQAKAYFINAGFGLSGTFPRHMFGEKDAPMYTL